MSNPMDWSSTVCRHMLGVLSLGMLFVCDTQAMATTVHVSPTDGGVVNKERVLYWLVRRGEISADASDDSKRRAVADFISRSRSVPDVMRAQMIAERRLITKARRRQQSPGPSLAIAEREVTKTVNVLGVLVDFPDLPHDNPRLSPGDSDMYYGSYPANHYQNLLFSPSGFRGPANQNLISGYQYFKQVSGGSFFFTGTVRDWVRADNKAAYYGGNDANNQDNDSAVAELVLEAVTKAVVGMTAAELAAYDVEDPYDRDNDGNLDEPDGIIDHIMLFHSSIGEEAGGGVLGVDAIWSHRFFLPSTAGTYGQAIPGTNLRAYGYTVQPIDAAAGVCVHEFGHDLGLLDEYDLDPDSNGSPVGSWSLMSDGSWAGALAGAEPVGLSPYARSVLQRQFKGKWLHEQAVSLDSLTVSGSEFTLNEAVDAEGVNQLSLQLPSEPQPFRAPYGGTYQYYSNQGDRLNNAMSFDVALPNRDSLTLKMLAHWQIEPDYDYMQLQVDGVPIAGNHTKPSSFYDSGRHVITGASADIAGNQGADHWVELSYDLSAYRGASHNISIVYRTDEYLGGYGIAIDNLSLVAGADIIYADDAETEGKMVLSGFVRTDDTRPGGERRYLVQLRSHSGIDKGLASVGYDPGVLLWFENLDYGDNNVSEHPGFGLIGVVDADQNPIASNSTEVQIRDAALSLWPQTAFAGDSHLSSVSLFDDALDYSAPLRPQAGLVLPRLGLTLELLSQAIDNSSARIRLKRHDGKIAMPAVLSAAIGVSVDGATASFSARVGGGDGNYNYAWDFGVSGATSSEANPSYSYPSSGDYQVSLTVTDGSGASVTVNQQITVRLTQRSASSGGGASEWQLMWVLAILAMVRWRFTPLPARLNGHRP